MKNVISFIENLLKIAGNNPADLRHVFGTANAAAESIVDPESDTRTFPSVKLEDLPAAGGPFSFHFFPHVPASITLSEAAALVTMMRGVNARRVFEFGTYKGVSTTQLAMNLPVDGMVFTLDLPEDHPAYSLEIPKAEERQIAAETGKGILVPKELRNRVTFLRCDSAHFDAGPYAASMDLVFVDGAHSYDYVKNDSEKGIAMLRRGGMIAWHDCIPSHRDVVRYLKALDMNVMTVEGTALAYATLK